MERAYRLGRFKIVEKDGAFRWEAPAGLGTEKTGRCLILGDFLILGPSEGEAPGFLKREYLDHLKKLPPWRKTRFYCQSHAVHECKGGHSITVGLENVPARKVSTHFTRYTSAPSTGESLHGRLLSMEAQYGVWSALKSTLTGLRQTWGTFLKHKSKRSFTGKN